MRWQSERRSDNVEDQRGISPAGMAVGGGLGTIVIVLILSFLTGQDPRALLQQVQKQAPPGPARQGPAAPKTPEQERQGEFVAATLAMTEDVWKEQFAKLGKRYEEPKLRLFSGQVSTEGCGSASSAVGPFYCPADRRVYLDTDFFDELTRKFRAPGEFAQAYVIAHEIGHHVQNLLGISEKISRMQRQASSKAEANKLSQMLELQADFLAGVWAHHAEKKKHILEEGDIESALRAATAIGDDALQKAARGIVVPDSFTHGTSAERVHWFRKGLVTGDLDQGDTYKAPKY
jgi:predicted metalloprotease